MLNNLLFGDPAATAALGAASSDAAQANQGSPNGPADADSSRHQAAISSGCWSSLWPSDADLHGPDLSTFAIPSDGCSGLGFKVCGWASAKHMPGRLGQWVHPIPT